MSRSRLLLGAALLALGGAAAFHFSATPAADRAPAPVATAPAGPVGVGALGRVEPASRILRLAPPASQGSPRIERLLVEEGSRVAAGATLAVFSDAALKDAAVAEAAARVATARATAERVRNGGRESEITAQRARIASLRAAEELADREAGRAEALVRSAAGNAAAAERNRFLATRAAAERAQAEADLETLERARPEEVARVEAEHAAAEAALARARVEAAQARLVAPIAGTVLRVLARAGETVGGDGVLELADLSRLDIVADVYETDLPRLREGSRAEIIVPGEAQRFSATVREIGWTVRRTLQGQTDPVAAVDARTVQVRLSLDEAGRAALERRSNMQVQVAIRP
jgi:HlyD family secretion protein